MSWYSELMITACLFNSEMCTDDLYQKKSISSLVSLCYVGVTLILVSENLKNKRKNDIIVSIFSQPHRY